MAAILSESQKNAVGVAVKLKYSCTLCPLVAKTLSQYKTHVQTHSSERPFKCPECPFRAKMERYVKHHVIRTHLPASVSRRFPCPHSGCSYAAKTKATLENHLKAHLNERSFACSFRNCNYTTNQKGTLLSHVKRHTGEKPFVCQFEFCDFAASQRGHLVAHTRTHTKEKPYKCPETNCDFSAAGYGGIKQHQSIHEPKPIEGAEEELRLFPCPICEYSGKTKTHLNGHIQRHTLEKLFKCDKSNCNFEAKTNTELKIHKVVHSDEKPFACTVESCELRFKTKPTLSLHLKTHSEERQYKCELCPYRGKIRNHVRKHIKDVHSDPNFRPFKCTVAKCSWTGKRKGHLTQHLSTHRPGKRYLQTKC